MLTPDDVIPLREICRWLAENRVPQRNVSFVPLPKQSPKNVAQIESPHSLSQSAGREEPVKPTLPETRGIPLQREGGTFVVPVSINDQLTLKFVIDSGAADVSIPADVVMTLLRTGTLTPDDFLGRKHIV